MARRDFRVPEGDVLLPVGDDRHPGKRRFDEPPVIRRGKRLERGGERDERSLLGKGVAGGAHAAEKPEHLAVEVYRRESRVRDELVVVVADLEIHRFHVTLPRLRLPPSP